MAVPAQYNSANALLQDMRNRMRHMGGTPGLPVLFGPANVLEDFQLQYAATGASGQQLQLLTPFSIASHVPNPENNMACGLLGHPKKRLRESDEVGRQQNSQIAMSNFLQVQADAAMAIPNSAAVSTGLRLAYDDEEPNSSVTSASGNAGSFTLLPFLNEDISAEMERQRTELEHYLRVQEEQFGQALKEMRQRHFTSFLGAMEEGLGRRLREKDVEVENLSRKNKELADKIKQVALEAQSWHSRAKYNEAMVSALRSNLQQAVAQSKEQSREGCGDSQVDDAASSHYGDSNTINIHSSANIINMNNTNTNIFDIHARTFIENKELKEQRSCRICRNNDVSILLLPCRHLCLCKDCENMLDVCPLCRSLKSASVQVYMS